MGPSQIYVLNISKEAFKNAPTSDRRNFESTALEPWRREVDRFWEEDVDRWLKGIEEPGSGRAMSKQSTEFSGTPGERPLSGAAPPNVPRESEDSEGEGVTRRDFLVVATGAMTAVGAGFATWSVLDSMNPSADVLARSSVEVDLSPVEFGQRILVSWRQRPIFINHRTDDEIARARADDTADLIDPERDRDRVQREEWLVAIGICTHLGCVPLGQRRGDRRGKFGGYFCACHGSLYDTAGRVRQGPAPRNLDLPPYTFVDATTLRIG